LITQELQETVRRLYKYRCGYCGTEEIDAGSELENDHYRPLARGGDSDLSNLVYCCPACNRFKGSFWAESDSPRRLLHPLRDDLNLHFHQEDDGGLTALTETGKFHIEVLHLNRPQLRSSRLKQLRREQLEQSLAAFDEEASRWDDLTAARQSELLEILRAIYRLPNQ
jgi:hypothetical protein